MDMASGTGNVPNYDSNFPVDFALVRQPAASDSWYTQSRMTGTKYLFTNTTASEATLANWVWDSNVGWAYGGSNAYQSWMWKRHAGFDVVTYKGDGVAGHQIPHSLNKTPEMIWIKNREHSTTSWGVYHKGLNSGTNPEQYALKLDTSNSEQDYNGWWNDTAPTATNFTVGYMTEVNENTKDIIAMLFASVDGISKVGSYTGNGTSGLGITVGFQPRFVIIKNISSNYSWLTFDTTRGWGSGNDKLLKLNSDAAEYTSTDYGAPTSNGFTVGSSASINQNNDNFIYYAHA
jgi:hypothetical protein